MARGYWMIAYRSVSDPAALSRYAAAAGPIIQAHGGRILARGQATKAYEAGLTQRLVIIEFETVESAIATYESAEYQSALALLAASAERDVRMIEGA